MARHLGFKTPRSSAEGDLFWTTDILIKAHDEAYIVKRTTKYTTNNFLISSCIKQKATIISSAIRRRGYIAMSKKQATKKTKETETHNWTMLGRANGVNVICIDTLSLVRG